MKKLFVPKGKEELAINEIKKKSDGNDYISVVLNYNPYVIKNIELINNLLLEENDLINYKDEFVKYGLEIEEYIHNGSKMYDIHFTNGFDYFIREYLFIIIPGDSVDACMEYALIPACIFPLHFRYYEELINVVPDLVNDLIDKGLAFLGEEDCERRED